MIANSNIDFLTLKNISVAHSMPRRFLAWLYMAVLIQPLLHSLVFWLISKNIVTTITGFMFGVAMIIIWMSYDLGFIRALNQYIHRCTIYKKCNRKMHTIYNHIDSIMHLFWVFIAPPLSVIVVSLYAIISLLINYHFVINLLPH